ncbi:MAG: hypothetical protein ACHQEB_05335 [Chitinophagales bacterium]
MTKTNCPPVSGAFLNDPITGFLSKLYKEDHSMKKIFLLALISGCCIIASGQTYTGAKTARTWEEKLNEAYCTGLFKSYDGTIFDMLNNNSSALGYTNILNWLNGRVAGLQVLTSKTGVPIPYIRNSKASIYVDEILVDPDYLYQVPVTDIAMIKIIKGPFLGNIGNASGAIAIYTIDEDGDE